ncbi:MAG: sugar phosphate isomerase/epimerase family protein [Armatimonadota bacterium]
MRYGCCIGLGGYIPPTARNAGRTGADSFDENIDWMLQQIDYLKRVGYDYVEFAVQMLSCASAEDYTKLRRAISSASLKPEAFNCFIPGNIKIVGPEVDTNAICSYLELALARTSECGAKVIVFGSGVSRNVPDGYPMYKAESQISDFLNTAAGIASKYNIIIAIEPLNRKECNIINLVADATELAGELDKPQIKVLADFYHIDEEKESFDAIEMAGPLMAHVHVADTNRLNPGSGSYDYHGFFSALKYIDYQGRVSLECILNDFEKDTASSLAFMKDVWNQV